MSREVNCNNFCLPTKTVYQMWRKVIKATTIIQPPMQRKYSLFRPSGLAPIVVFITVVVGFAAAAAAAAAAVIVSVPLASYCHSIHQWNGDFLNRNS